MIINIDFDCGINTCFGASLESSWCSPVCLLGDGYSTVSIIYYLKVFLAMKHFHSILLSKHMVCNLSLKLEVCTFKPYIYIYRTGNR